MAKGLSADDVKRRAERRCGRKIPDVIWKSLNYEVELVRNGAQYAEEDLDIAVQKYLAVMDAGSGRARPKRVVSAAFPVARALRPNLSREEKRRIEVQRELYAKIAAAHPRVRGCRARYLDGCILTNTEARDFLNSRALALLSRDDLRAEAMSLTGLRVEDEREGPENGPGGEAEWVRRLKIGWPGGPSHEFVIRDALWSPANYAVLKYPLKDQGVAELQVRGGSVLNDIREGAEYISPAFGWSVAETVWFILTASVPKLEAVHPHVSNWSMVDHTHEQITLVIQPWVSAESVASVYRSAQTWALGRKARTIGTDKLDLFEFVEARRGKEGRLPPWPTLYTLWRRARKIGREDRRDAWRGFQRDYGRIRDELFFPLYADGESLKAARKARREKVRGPFFRARTALNTREDT